MKPISRRNFIKSSAIISGTALGASLLPKFSSSSVPSGPPDIVSVPFGSPISNLDALLEPLGGIEAFVKPGNSVGFLVNSPWQHKGFYTDPELVLQLMKMCREAGASEIICYKPVREGYWEEASSYEAMRPMIEEIAYGEERTVVDIPEGKFLKSAEVFKVFLETDVYIAVPVAKHHNGTLFSGVLKGLMGASSRDTNRHMHSPDGEYTYEKEEYLSGCIADLNLVRLPDLSVMDAGVCATSNGPRGPGETVSPGRILAGTDPLAMDVYAASLIGMDPKDIYTFNVARDHKLGKYDLAEIEVMQIS